MCCYPPYARPPSFALPTMSAVGVLAHRCSHPSLPFIPSLSLLAMASTRKASKRLRAIDWLGGVAEEHAASANSGQLLALCGVWLDRKGSRYILTPASLNSLDVHTIRPSGDHRFTAHLIRLYTKKGAACVIWGSHRYTMAQRDQDSVLWQGRGPNDRFEWTRISGPPSFAVV